ncbi:hypothetical protein MDA_GLEAN10022807 [Myotis davidii]|uniref:Uncharacterized protein n=1 Tax=Myotis davidii TaxID=225400 RepID=L5M179_MYODS|nr:hypothetical protein MDA_GLEAN10022807 [Myotis davidii]
MLSGKWTHNERLPVGDGRPTDQSESGITNNGQEGWVMARTACSIPKAAWLAKNSTMSDLLQTDVLRSRTGALQPPADHNGFREATRPQLMSNVPGMGCGRWGEAPLSPPP